MTTKDLRILGISIEAEEIPVSYLFGERFYQEGLSEETTKRISLIKDIIREYNSSQPLDEGKAVWNSKDAADLMQTVLLGLKHEELWAVFLGTGNLPIKRIKLAEGNSGSCLYDKQRIVRELVMSGGKGIVIYHNHPSGNPQPSKHDIEETTQLSKMVALFGLAFVDHIIFSDGKYYSFADSKEFEACIAK